MAEADFGSYLRCMTTRQAVVTGGNSGVGLAVALGLAHKGYALWITGRNEQSGAQAVAQLQAVGAPAARFVSADFTSFASTHALVQTLRGELAGRLDALVHSSGVLNSERRVSADGLEEIWASQFVGRYLVTEGLKDVLVATPDARVVFVGSVLLGDPTLNEADLTLKGRFSMMAAVQQAYLATQLYMERFAREHPKGPFINGGHAGAPPTGITRGVNSAGRWLFRFARLVMGISLERAAENFVALASDPALSGVTGRFFPKPGKLSVHQPMTFSAEQHAAFERIVARLRVQSQS